MGRPALEHELVADAANCAEMDRMGGISLKLLSDMKDVIVDCVRGIVVVTECSLEEFFARDDPLGVLYEEF